MTERYRMNQIITDAIDQMKRGGDSQKAIAYALIAIAIAIDDAGDNITTAIERETT